MRRVYKLIRIAVISNGIAELLIIVSMLFSADWFGVLAICVCLGLLLSLSLLLLPLLPLLFRAENSPRCYYLIAAICEIILPVVFFFWAMHGVQC